MKVIKIGAAGCPGCVIMKPRWQEIEQENPWLDAEYFDADEQKDKIKKYNLDELPTFIFLDQTEVEITRKKGIVSKSALLELINEHKDK